MKPQNLNLTPIPQEDERIRHSRHSEEVVARIIEFHDQGMRSKDIWKISKEIFGYTIKTSTISTILRRYGRNPKENTYRAKSRKRGL